MRPAMASARTGRSRFVRGLVLGAVTAMLLLTLAIAWFALQSRGSGPALGPRPASVPTFEHVFLIIEENRSYSQVINSPSTPYISSLKQKFGLATNYYGIDHPSTGNYLALTGGSTFGNPSSCTPAQCPINAPNIADRVEAAGKTWRAYIESMPSPCFTANKGRYVTSHNPFVYYDNVRNDPGRCRSHDLPYTRLAADLASARTTPSYSLIIPDQFHNMHDGSIAAGDGWLEQEVGQIFASPAWTKGSSVLFIIWDEDDFTPVNHVAALVVGPKVKPGYASATRYDHYSLLRTIEVLLGLKPLTDKDASAAPMTEFFTR